MRGERLGSLVSAVLGNICLNKCYGIETRRRDDVFRQAAMICEFYGQANLLAGIMLMFSLLWKSICPWCVRHLWIRGLWCGFFLFPRTEVFHCSGEKWQKQIQHHHDVQFGGDDWVLRSKITAKLQFKGKLGSFIWHGIFVPVVTNRIYHFLFVRCTS